VFCLNRHLPQKKTFQPFKKDLGSKLEYLSRTKLLMPIVRIYALKQYGGGG